MWLRKMRRSKTGLWITLSCKELSEKKGYQKKLSRHSQMCGRKATEPKVGKFQDQEWLSVSNVTSSH